MQVHKETYHSFHKKIFLNIDQDHQARIHHYKYINALSFAKTKFILLDAETRKLGKYKLTLKKIKLLRHFNNKNLTHIPKFLFANIKFYHQCLQKIDCIDFTNLVTLKRLRKLKCVVLVDIFPRELKFNTDLTTIILSLDLFSSRTFYFGNFNENPFSKDLMEKLKVPDYSKLENLIVEEENAVYRLTLLKTNKFRHLEDNFREASIFVNCIQVRNMDIPSLKRYKGDVNTIKMFVVDSSLQFLSRLMENIIIYDQIQELIYYEHGEAENIEEEKEEEKIDLIEKTNEIPRFIYLNKLVALKNLVLSFECSFFEKEILNVINSISLPASLVVFSLQLKNCNLSIAVEEFALSHSVFNKKSLISNCFRDFLEGFETLPNLQIFSLEVNDPFTDVNLLLDFSTKILERIDFTISKLNLTFDSCKVSQKSLEIQDLLNEIARLKPQSLFISFPRGSDTVLDNHVILKTITSNLKEFFFSNWSKETLNQLTNSDEWLFGTCFGTYPEDFSSQELLKPMPDIEAIIKDVSETNGVFYVKSDSVCNLFQNISHSYLESDFSFVIISKKKMDVQISKRADIMFNSLIEIKKRFLEMDFINSIE